MRSTTKAIIGFGSMWGLFAFGVCLWGSFTIGSNDTAPEIIAILMYGLTILPACILAIWFTKAAAAWLIALCPLSLFGIAYQQAFSKAKPFEQSHFLAVLPLLLAILIPAVLGVLLLRTAESPQPNF